MKLRNKIFMAAVISSSISMNCYAADLDIKLLNRNVQIDSQMSEGDFASLWVLNPDVTQEEFSAVEYIDFSIAAYCNQMKITKDNKVFDFDMYDNAPTGIYTAILGGNGTTSSDTFEYVSQGDLTGEGGYLSKLNSLTAEQICSLLSSDSFADAALVQLGIDKEVLNTLDTDAKKSEYFKIMLLQKPFNADNISDAAKKAEVVYKINNSTDKYAAISPLLDVYGADSKYKEMYESMSGAQEELKSYIAKNTPFTAPTSAYSTILEGIALSKLNTTRWENMAETLNKYASYFNIIYSGDLTAISSDAAKTMANYNFTSLNEVQSVLNSAVASMGGGQSLAPSLGGLTSGNNVGSGGGGSSVVKPELNANPPVPGTAEPFGDLAGVEWAKESIMRLYELKIVNGDGNGNFNPNDNVTREQFIAMLVRAFGIEKSEAACSFTDVAKDDWAYIYVATAFENGIVTGINNEQFGYGNPIIRQDLATMADRAVKFMNVELEDYTLSFNDTEEISDYAVSAVGRLCGGKVINGMDGNIFAPKKYATRAEAAKIICGILDLINEKEAQ